MGRCVVGGTTRRPERHSAGAPKSHQRAAETPTGFPASVIRRWAAHIPSSLLSPLPSVIDHLSRCSTSRLLANIMAPLLEVREAPIIDYKNAIWAYYRYEPSIAAAILFAILFFLITTFQSWQIYKAKNWYYVVFVIGGLFEVIGYIGRAVSASQTPRWTLGAYIVQALFTLVPPALYAASIYMTLGRMVRAVGAEALSPIRIRWMTSMFVSGDILSFLLQACGAGIMAGGTLENLTTGANIIVGGLSLQLLYFGFFVIAGGVFHYRMIKYPSKAPNRDVVNWHKHMNVLYAASVLIFVRSLFRTIEYGLGNDGYLMRHEAFLYVFDACLMLAVMVVYAVFPPTEIGQAIKAKREMEKAQRPESGQTSESDAEDAQVAAGEKQEPAGDKIV
ncbi:hypothetical protein FH972_025850 [Carpinus fangiana]|uniref:RTA1 domain protein n=1 Tax=Carpinus fangiana TaxID=176857 RepID=A0A5N6L2M0_9ROSI|nr:hypothetical protein FH972_025850 [Carpinus fangiana]